MVTTLVPGEQAPNFTLTDANGQSHTLSDALRRGPVLLAFWKVSCGTSRLLFPYLERLRQTYPSDTWQVWGIAQEPANVIASFNQRVGPITFPQLIDFPAFTVSKRYDPIATPTLFYIDSSGKIAETAMGFSKDALNALSGQVAQHLGAGPVEIAPPDDGQPAFRPG